MEFIKTHRFESIIIGIFLLIIIILLVFTKIFFFSDKGSVYGSRLDGIDRVRISQDKLDKIQSDLKKNDIVIDVESNVSGKIINLMIETSPQGDLNVLKSISGEILNNFSEKEKEFYDIQIFLISREESQIYPTIGYKSKSSFEIVWMNS